MLLRIFGWSIAITVAALAASLLLGDAEALALVAILIVLEVSLSFDNAVVNAKVLIRMSAFWQKMFLTVGILIAVFGMRLVFPLVLVGITADLNPIDVFDLAREGGDGPGTYHAYLDDAYPAIAGFGGMFLAMLWLQWLFEEREHRWLRWLEVPLAKAGVMDSLDVVIASTGLFISGYYLAESEDQSTVLIAGLLGMITYLAVNGLGALFENAGDEESEEDGETAPARRGPSGAARATGKAGFFLFLYLEVLDASFSFDGVIGAFAVSQDIFVIMTGLGVGAFWVRSLTVYLVRRGTLQNYIYLEHGAHWAIGALAVVLLTSVKWHIPELVTGLIGVFFIALSLYSSIRHNRKYGAPEAIHVDAAEPEEARA